MITILSKALIFTLNLKAFLTLMRYNVYWNIKKIEIQVRVSKFKS
ncbi:hypothetical protein F3D3_1358 [Fusibacter sp. 3D3]|nr:hypothetical protein F3D3_1354 [Fusibacter sp. 3D3]GAU76761.1 hypothetical protein F3D3_1358 [Fusibacter sp. 3D3]